MSTTDDLGRMAIGAPSLQEVFIVSIPDCLLVKSWSRNERDNEDEAAAHLGNLVRVAGDLLTSVSHAGTADWLTVEAETNRILLARVSSGLAAGYVFDPRAPLGLVRVQARQLLEHMRTSIAPGGAPRASAPAPAPAPAPERVTRPIARPAPAPTTTPSAAPAERPSSISAPRGVRIMNFFLRYAPDPHASLLRLSLRTGIPLRLLETPSDLNSAQIESVAASVRDILGRTHLEV